MKRFFLATVLSLLLFPFVSITTAAARDYYGAVSYSPRTGAYGASYNMSTRSNAQRRAQRECANRASRNDCRVVIWFRNACGALANNEDGAYGSGWAGNRANAERQALRSCHQNGNNCGIVVWACTDR